MKRRRKYAWSTRPVRPPEVVSPALAAARQDFFRFTTTPDWEGVRRSQEGAHLAMIEAARG